jgi:hypothetical protein
LIVTHATFVTAIRCNAFVLAAVGIERPLGKSRT